MYGLCYPSLFITNWKTKNILNGLLFLAPDKFLGLRKSAKNWIALSGLHPSAQ